MDVADMPGFDGNRTGVMALNGFLGWIVVGRREFDTPEKPSCRND